MLHPLTFHAARLEALAVRGWLGVANVGWIYKSFPLAEFALLLEGFDKHRARLPVRRVALVRPMALPVRPFLVPVVVAGRNLSHQGRAEHAIDPPCGSSAERAG